MAGGGGQGGSVSGSIGTGLKTLVLWEDLEGAGGEGGGSGDRDGEGM